MNKEMETINVNKGTVEALRANCEDDWYFGAITRSEAENILKKNGLSDGLFLVRDSVSSPGDYVLSCVQKGSVIHYQILKIGEDPFFSIDNGIAIHGLDMLLKHLRELSATNNSLILIKNYCHCLSPPADTRRHGRSNLLHRAVSSGCHRIVDELLRADNKLNLEARNEHGRTTLHLAIELDEEMHCKIVEQLIDSGAYVNCKDTESMTPLHLCAKYNKPKFANLLLDKGKAITFGRTREESWVALHLAAYYGNVKVIKALLEWGAAPQPRSSRNETPADIALKMNHLECKRFCDFYADRPLDNLVPKNQWFCEHITSRYETNRLFEKSGLRDGSFLVRKSRSKPNTYVLSMAYETRVYNFEIQNNNLFYFIDTGPYWPSLDRLITYYMSNSDGLPSQLIAPIGLSIDLSINESLIQCNTKTKNNNDLGCSAKSGSPNEMIKSILFIDSIELEMGPLIGTGEYGDVFKGIWKKANKERTLVAIKILRKRDVQMRRKIDNFLKEVEVMTSVKHPNIIKLLGVCVGPTLMMVQQLAPMGSVLDFLIDHPNEVDICHDIKLWSTQIATGMRYLESRHFVHRDLAARNVLLFSIQLIKISDFGLSRALSGEDPIYKSMGADRWPFRWYAPESLKFGTFTPASDVWSYGVVLWEMYSLGEQPYGDIENSQIIGFIEDGKRLSKPLNCNDFIFALISMCWSVEAKNRPTFHEIVEILLANDCTYESIRNELKSSIQM